MAASGSCGADHSAESGKAKAAIAAGNTQAHVPGYEGFDADVTAGGYARFTDLRNGGDWEKVQADVTAAGLRGLGGAGVPSGKKSGFMRAKSGPRDLAVVGDEASRGGSRPLSSGTRVLSAS